MDHLQLITTLRPPAESTLLKSWEEELRLLEAAISRFKSIAHADGSKQTQAQRITEAINWCRSTIRTLESRPAETELNRLAEALEAAVATLPESETLPLTRDDLQRQPGDSFRQGAWKQGTSMRWGAQSVRRSSANGIRRLFKRELPPEIEHTRTFSPQHFTRFQIMLPMLGIVRDSWRLRRELLDDLFHPLTGILAGGTEASDEEIEAVLAEARAALDKASVSFQSLLTERLDALPENVATPFHFAGTGAYPESKYGPQPFAQGLEQLERAASRATGEWTNYLVAVRDSTIKDLELTLLRVRAQDAGRNASQRLQDRVGSDAKPAIQSARDTIAHSLEIFSGEAVKDEDTLRALLRREGRSLLKQLQKDALPAMMDGVLASRSDTLLAGVLASIKRSTAELSPVHRIALNRDEKQRPKVRVEEIALRELVEKDLLPDLERDHRAVVAQAEKALQEMLRKISETDQVVEFNLEAALNVMRGEEGSEALEEARSAAVEGVERALRQVDDLLEMADRYVADVRDGLDEETREFGEGVASLADNRKIVDLKLQLARAAAEQRFRKTVRKVLSRIIGALPGLLRIVRGALGWLRKRYTRIRSISGLTDESSASREGVERFLRETNGAINALPTVYRRLFRLEPLTDERFFAGRDRESTSLAQAIELWKNGHFAATVVIGEKGSGRTSMLNMAQQKLLKGVTVKRMELTRELRDESALVEALVELAGEGEASTLDDLAVILLEQAPRVYILEDMQNLFLRHVHGFSLLEKFLQLVTKVGRHHLFLITCSQYAWNYLERVIQVDRYFNRLIPLGGFSEERLRDILLKRHRVSGYKLEFTLPESVEKSRRYKKAGSDAERHDILLESFLERINSIASGNVTVALFLWMRAVRPAEGGVLDVETDFEFDPAFLAGLPAEEMFSLAALILHEGLSVEDHTIVFHQHEEKSRLMLGRLTNRGLLQEEGELYRVHPFLYRAVVQMLRSRNMLP